MQGYRVELGEIESIAFQIGGIDLACAVAMDESGRIGLAIVGDSALRDDAVRRELSARLPTYMVPAVVVLVPTLPLGPTGKIDRDALELILKDATRRIG